MKAFVNQHRKYFAIIALVIYAITISTYIIFLKNRTTTAFQVHFAKAAGFKQVINQKGGGNFYEKQHGAFKTTIENKRKIINSQFETAANVPISTTCRHFNLLAVNKSKLIQINQVHQHYNNCTILCTFRI